MKRETRWTSWGVVAILLLATACGDGGGGGGEPTPSPTATPTPIAVAALSGTYDSNRGIAIVSGQDQRVGVQLGLVREAFASFGGTLEDDGTVHAAGIETRQDMGSIAITGDLHVALSSTESHITGTLRAADGTTFNLDATRPFSGTPGRFTGRYTVLFAKSPSGPDTPASVVIDVAIPSDGRGHSLAPADATADDGTRVGTFAAGDCVATPTGRLQCRLPYQGIVGPGPFGGPATFDAVLTGDIITGPHGVQDALGSVIVTNQAPITAHAFAYTTWSATLVSAP
jgi:hypothetical protein